MAEEKNVNRAPDGRVMPEPPKPDFSVKLAPESSVKHVIGVVSGSKDPGKGLPGRHP